MNTIFKTTFLLSLLTILLVAMGGAVGGTSGMIVAFLIAAAMNFGSYWFSDTIVLRMYRAREIPRDIPPSFFGMAGLPMLDASPAAAHMFIVNPLTGGGLMALFSTHQPMEERIARLESLAVRTH